MSQILLKISELDRNIMLLVAQYRTKLMTKFLRLITYTAIGRAWFGVALVLTLIGLGRIQVIVEQNIFLNALFAPLLAWILGHLLKKAIGRKRPFQCIDKFFALVESPVDDSFPSLHAGSTTAFFVALLILHHPLVPWVGTWAVLVCFSRIYLGVHFLSDIIGGIILGVFCGSLIYQIVAVANSLFSSYVF